MLILGAWWTMKGQIFRAASTYVVADFVWIYLAYEKGGLQGTLFIIVGVVLGLVALYKMNRGIFHKNITKD